MSVMPELIKYSIDLLFNGSTILIGIILLILTILFISGYTFRNQLVSLLLYRSKHIEMEIDKINHNEILEKKGGRFNFNVPLAQYTRFRVGGPAQIFFRPADLNNLMSTLKKKPQNLHVTPIGMGSNLLVRDGGVPGIVIHLGKGFQDFKIFDDTAQVEVGAGLSQLKFSKLCAKAGIGGLEFFCGIPGSIGGALRMNAGAHGTEVKDKLISTCVVDNLGNFHCLNVTEMKLSYRYCSLPKDWIFVSAKFQGEKKPTEEIQEKMENMIRYRDECQPVKEKTAGCTFVNPDNGIQAWKLIRDAECHNLRKGGAEVSGKHFNFLVNLHSATAKDLEELGETIRLRVHEKSGLLLRWEVERIGIPL